MGIFSNLKHHGLSKFYYRFSSAKDYPNIWDFNEDVADCRLSKSSCKLILHELIVVGYIEHPDREGEGLLILRNSWGSRSADAGNYYMSYSYANRMLLSVIALKKL